MKNWIMLLLTLLSACKKPDVDPADFENFIGPGIVVTIDDFATVTYKGVTYELAKKSKGKYELVLPDRIVNLAIYEHEGQTRFLYYVVFDLADERNYGFDEVLTKI